MSLRIRRGLNDQRITKILDTGEIAWTTDSKKLYVGDGSTAGGINILANSVDTTSGLAWDNATQKIKYTGALENALQNIVEDTSPELGGNLNLNNKTINGTGTINFTGNISASALSLATGLGANLPLNGRSIIGTGNINIIGSVGSTTVNTGIVNVTSNLVNGGVKIETNNSNLDTGFDLLTVNAFYNTSVFPASIIMSRGRGTKSAPTIVQTGDVIGALTFTGSTDADTTKPAAFMLINAVSSITAGPDGIVPGQFQFSTTNSLGDFDISLTIDSTNGVVAGKSLTPGVYANVTARDAAITVPAPGMLVYVTADSKFYGYVDDAGSTSPGWVALN